MDIRKKLVELKKVLRECLHFNYDEFSCNMSLDVDLTAENLIANGVTVQEWISVKDRLPEKNTSVLASTDKGIVFQCLYAYDGWDLWEGNEVNITHWQPIPQPPKGE